LLDDNFHIKLTDFGTARILEAPSTSSSPLTQDQSTTSQQENEKLTRRRNSFVGTAQFVAPEILQGKEPSIGSDLWGLGCIIFQMLTGNHLFAGR
jgi:3-phosphoinositide dependent protein kinase-1